ncbi:MAG: DUF2169 domain-containing protein [Byssovorax sp.]
MPVVTPSSLRARTLLFQPRKGAFALTVIAKATLHLTAGTASLADEPDEILDAEDHWDDDPKRSLRAPSDLWPIKPRPEVILVGTAWAPRRVPVHRLLVRLVAGELDKAIEVFGPRLWTVSGKLLEGAPWTQMPLRYERAAGGPDTWNPVGMRLDGSPDLYGQKHLPNLQPEGVELRDRGQFLPPVGFGPIASSWPLRRERLGRRADRGALFWLEEPLGDDFDRAFFQDAPLDQQVGALRDDERIELHHLHPAHPRLVTRLPGLRPRAAVEVGGKSTELSLGADTLWIDTDRQIATLTFRAHLPIADPEAPRSVEVRLDGRSTKVPAGNVSAGADVVEVTAVQSSPLTSPAIPFVLAGSSLSSSAIHTAPPEVRDPPAGLPAEGGRRTTQEVVVPAGGLPGPAWLAAAPTGPETPALAALPSPPSAPAPPALVDLLTRPVVGPAPSVAAASAAAIAAPAPVLRSAPGSREASAPPAPLVAPAPVTSAPLGAAAASDAAAGLARSRAAPPPVDPAPDAGPEKAAPPATLELLWFDPALVARLRAHPDYQAFTKPPAKQSVQPGKPPPPPPSAEAQEKAARADVHQVLRKGPLAKAGAPPGEAGDDPDAPLLLLEGQLSFPFDELAELEAAAVLARPLALADKRLKELLDAVAEAQRAGIEAPEVARGLSSRIREAWAKANRALPEGHLAAQIEQRLLEKRQYQRREIFDDGWIRALYTPPSSEVEVPAYLPEKLSRRLPLFARFSVRMLIELYPQQDQRERHGAALKVAALGRVAPRPRIDG